MPGQYDFDSEVEGLRSQLGRLKEVASAIGEESKLQNSAIAGLEDAMERAQHAMKRGLRKVNKALQQSKSNHFMHLALFCLLIFCVLYAWLRFYKF
eukprot:jgi/Astpho2/7438/gw1.00114.194.1_t